MLQDKTLESTEYQCPYDSNNCNFEDSPETIRTCLNHCPYPDGCRADKKAYKNHTAKVLLSMSARKLREQGKSVAEIAELLGRSRMTIYRSLQ